MVLGDAGVHAEQWAGKPGAVPLFKLMRTPDLCGNPAVTQSQFAERSPWRATSERPSAVHTCTSSKRAMRINRAGVVGRALASPLTRRGVRFVPKRTRRAARALLPSDAPARDVRGPMAPASSGAARHAGAVRGRNPPLPASDPDLPLGLVRSIATLGHDAISSGQLRPRDRRHLRLRSGTAQRLRARRNGASAYRGGERLNRPDAAPSCAPVARLYHRGGGRDMLLADERIGDAVSRVA
jgi:hypothetical protein